MQNKGRLWQAFLAVSITALTVPGFSYSESDSTVAPSVGTASSASAPADTAAAATSDEAKTDTDRTLNANIRQALSADAMLAGSTKSIQLKTEEGEVTLEGSVFNKDAKEMIEEKVKKVQGVKDVNNELEVASNEAPSSSSSMGSSGSSMGGSSSRSLGSSGSPSAGSSSIPTR